MNVRTLAITAASLVAGAALTAPASAASAVQLPGTNTYTFMTAIGGAINDTTVFTGLTSGSSLFLSFNGSSNAAFTGLTATFNNVAVPLTVASNLFSGLFTPTAGNTNTLVLTGNTSGVGAYTGTLTVLSAAVPEASTWAMMTIGFGALGYSLRRRRTTYSIA